MQQMNHNPNSDTVEDINIDLFIGVMPYGFILVLNIPSVLSFVELKE